MNTRDTIHIITGAGLYKGKYGVAWQIIADGKTLSKRSLGPLAGHKNEQRKNAAISHAAAEALKDLESLAKSHNLFGRPIVLYANNTELKDLLDQTSKEIKRTNNRMRNSGYEDFARLTQKPVVSEKTLRKLEKEGKSPEPWLFEQLTVRNSSSFSMNAYAAASAALSKDERLQSIIRSTKEKSFTKAPKVKEVDETQQSEKAKKREERKKAKQTSKLRKESLIQQNRSEYDQKQKENATKRQAHKHSPSTRKPETHRNFEIDATYHEYQNGDENVRYTTYEVRENGKLLTKDPVQFDYVPNDDENGPFSGPDYAVIHAISEAIDSIHPQKARITIRTNRPTVSLLLQHDIDLFSNLQKMMKSYKAANNNYEGMIGYAKRISRLKSQFSNGNRKINVIEPTELQQQPDAKVETAVESGVPATDLPPADNTHDLTLIFANAVNDKDESVLLVAYTRSTVAKDQNKRQKQILNFMYEEESSSSVVIPFGKATQKDYSARVEAVKTLLDVTYAQTGDVVRIHTNDRTMINMEAPEVASAENTDVEKDWLNIQQSFRLSVTPLDETPADLEEDIEYALRYAQKEQDNAIQRKGLTL